MLFYQNLRDDQYFQDLQIQYSQAAESLSIFDTPYQIAKVDIDSN